MNAVLNSARQPALEKLARDVTSLKKHARFIVLLTNSGPQIIDNHRIEKEGGLLGQIIAVLGPAFSEGVFVEQALLLEIGYSSTRPYSKARFKKKFRERQGYHLKPFEALHGRRQVRQLSNEELRLVYPLIEQCMWEIVSECRAQWKPESRGLRWVRGAGWIPRGIFFSFRKSDVSVYRQILMEDLRYRRYRYIAEHARMIRHWLKGVARNGSVQQLARNSEANKVAELLTLRYATPLYFHTLLAFFGIDIGLHQLVLRIAEVFKVPFIAEDAEARHALETQDSPLPEFEKIRCYIDRTRCRKIQGRECVVAEILDWEEKDDSDADTKVGEKAGEETSDSEIPF
jgi:hypothetical protein